MMKTTRNILARFDRMKKAEIALALAWVAAMLLGYFIAKVNITVGSFFLIVAMAAALMGAMNEVLMSGLRQKFEKLSENSQTFALWVRSY
jgi:hypothetical protein